MYPKYTYDPFGNANGVGISSNPYQYTGRENDGDQLYFYRARYYSPVFGRFMSEDPLGLRSGEIDFYKYVGDEPTDLIDPFGLWTVSLNGNLNYQWGPVTVQWSGGFAIDSSGNVGVVNTGGGGGGMGAGGSASVGVGVSNAPNICGLGGWFGNTSANIGLGPSVAGGGFGGVYHGRAVLGGAISVGGGADVGAGTTATDTWVTPIAGRYNTCSGQ